MNGAHRTLDEAKAARERLVKKHMKRLRKEEGAIKLVGGANEYEGNRVISQVNGKKVICIFKIKKTTRKCRNPSYGEMGFSV